MGFPLASEDGKEAERALRIREVTSVTLSPPRVWGITTAFDWALKLQDGKMVVQQA
jgi:hypothetical protein